MRPCRAAAVLVLSAASAFGCNLIFGIEEGKARPTDDTPDAPVEAAEAAPSAPSSCVKDSDCVPPNACYTGHCDTVLGACTYVECETKGRACSASTCDTTTNICGDPKDYGFRATSYRVADTTLGCGADPDACVAAVHPFVFLGTRDDTIALRVDGVVRASARRVPIANAQVRPAQIVASGRRVYILGAPQGTTPPYQLPIVTIDVPSDPTIASIAATTNVLAYAFPTAKAFAAPDGGIFVVHDDATLGSPATVLHPPLPEAGLIGVANPLDGGADARAEPAPTIPMYRLLASPAGANVVASSGARLLLYRNNGVVNVVSGGATAAVALGPDQPIQPQLFPFSPPRFAQGPDGVVLYGAAVNADALTPAGPDCNCNGQGRMGFVLPSSVATTIDPNLVFVAEQWINPQTGGACHQCAAGYAAFKVASAWIDAHTAIVATAGSNQDRGVTAVRVFGRDPPNGYPKRRVTTAGTEDPPGNLATDRMALTSASGYGYLVISDSEGNKVNLSIFDPRCDAR